MSPVEYGHFETRRSHHNRMTEAGPFALFIRQAPGKCWKRLPQDLTEIRTDFGNSPQPLFSEDRSLEPIVSKRRGGRFGRCKFLPGEIPVFDILLQPCRQWTERGGAAVQFSFTACGAINRFEFFKTLLQCGHEPLVVFFNLLNRRFPKLEVGCHGEKRNTFSMLNQGLQPLSSLLFCAADEGPVSYAALLGSRS